MSEFTNNPFSDLVIPQDLFGKAVAAMTNNKPELFVPRSVQQFKTELEDKGLSVPTDLNEFDVLLDDLNKTHAERMNEILGNMSDSSFAQSYMRLLSYVKPKLKAIDAEIPVNQELTQINITVINSKHETNNYS